MIRLCLLHLQKHTFDQALYIIQVPSNLEYILYSIKYIFFLPRLKNCNMKKGNKNPKTMACSYEEFDRLSDLSDDLIYRILSFLSTKESYRTCVLSTRWRSIYTKIPDLHFEFPEISDLVLSKEIKDVYAALLRRTGNLRKLSLYNRNDDIDSWQPQDIHVWVSKALDLKVKELDLGLELHEKTLLPHRLFISESLVVLKLRGKIQPKPDSSFDVYLPSLKILHLQSTMLNCIFDDHIEYSLTNFISGWISILRKYPYCNKISISFFK